MKALLAGVGIGIALAALIATLLLVVTDLRLTDQSASEEATDLALTGQVVTRCCGKPPTITVPDVSAESLEEAQGTLESHQLSARPVLPPGRSTSDNDLVVENQDPAAGTLASAGVKVSLFFQQ